MAKPPAGKEPNPKRKEWDNGKGKCDVCGPEPANAREAKYWRQKVYDHGHGYPPAKWRPISTKAAVANVVSAVQMKGAQAPQPTLFDIPNDPAPRYYGNLD